MLEGIFSTACSFTEIKELTFTAVFLIAVSGSFLHCTFMCGPMVMAQVTSHIGNMPIEKSTELTRLKGALLIPYHLGRMTTYIFLGIVSSVFGKTLINIWNPIGAILLILAGIGFILSSHPKLKNMINISASGIFNTQPTKNLYKKLSQSPYGINGYLLGVLLGFLPCAMVYSALILTASHENVIYAISIMTIFTLGTLPGLLSVALGSSLLAEVSQTKLRAIARGFTVVAGLWLCFVGITKLNIF